VGVEQPRAGGAEMQGLEDPVAVEDAGVVGA
jgi:hypothetical protein